MSGSSNTTCWIVAGASGAVGRRLRERLHARAVPVLAVSRTPRSPQVPGERWQCIDLYRDPAPAMREPGVVVSAGPLDGLAAWAARADWPAGTRVAALSSLSVETKRDSRDAHEHALAARLHSAEARLIALAQARCWHLNLLRASLIYDPQYGGLALDRLASVVGRVRVLPLPRDARGLRQPVHADDLAAALIAAIERLPASPVLCLPGGETLRFDVMLRRWLRARSVRVWMLPMPAAIGSAAVRLLTAWGGAAAVAAAQLARSRVDQCVDSTDWARLGLVPRPFQAHPERSV